MGTADFGITPVDILSPTPNMVKITDYSYLLKLLRAVARNFESNLHEE